MYDTARIKWLYRAFQLVNVRYKLARGSCILHIAPQMYDTANFFSLYRPYPTPNHKKPDLGRTQVWFN